MNKVEAIELIKGITSGRGTGDLRYNYKENFSIGSIAEKYWNEPEFTLGIEYGILIALSLAFNITDDDLRSGHAV